MNVAEFIVKYLKGVGVKHFFGYQGTMIAYYVDAVCKENEVYNHSFYNEQGAALAACGFSKSSGNISCAYATSGPGAVNLIQGIADAYYDSVSVVFITGQLNISEYSHISKLRQQGFQETNIIEITKPIVKRGYFIDSSERIISALPEAVRLVTDGRKGPVLLDIPMDIQRTEVKISEQELQKLFLKSSRIENTVSNANVEKIAKYIVNEIEKSSRPLVLIGNGIDRSIKTRHVLDQIVRNFGIPIVSSLMAKDMVSYDTGLYFGFMGASYGQRSANIIANKKTDLIISLGCRLSSRTIGTNKCKFAENAKIIRIDIDQNEIQRKVHDNEESYIADVNKLLDILVKCNLNKSYNDWISICNYIKNEMILFDDSCPSRYPNRFIKYVSDRFNYPLIVITDVGQNMMWVAHSFEIHSGQQILFSGAHGAMGFALPASIGAYYATGKPVLCFAGDGGLQMNIQELQYIFRENIPIKIFVLNNNSLGMITQVQDDYLDGRRFGTDEKGGFTSPDFSAIASAYGIHSYNANNINEFQFFLDKIDIENDKPLLFQINLGSHTLCHPKTYFGDEISDQRPYLPRELYSRIMNT